MIQVRRVLTADATNILNGTELQSIPSPGALTILAASSQADTELTVFTPGEEVAQFARPVNQRTNGVPSMQDDEAIVLSASPGDQPRIDINIVTAATCVLIVTFLTAEEILG